MKKIIKTLEKIVSPSIVANTLINAFMLFLISIVFFDSSYAKTPVKQTGIVITLVILGVLAAISKSANEHNKNKDKSVIDILKDLAMSFLPLLLSTFFIFILLAILVNDSFAIRILKEFQLSLTIYAIYLFINPLLSLLWIITSND